MVGSEETAGGNAEEERIFVAIRVRPLNDKQRAKNDGSDWECFNDNTIVLKNSPTEKSMPPEIFTFDRVFGCSSSTMEVYGNGIKEVALSVVRGINACIFAYGQTSSGKTYTMSGVTEYAVKDIYDYIEMHKSRKFVVRFSAMEIYNEVVTDLLGENGSPLRLLDDPEKGTIVEKLTEHILVDRSHLEELISTCAAHRKSAETFMNETSSRSHQILRLTVESSARENMKSEDSGTLVACVNFVDLAGSERASQTLSAGTRLREGSHINRSLLTIGTVIRKLSKSRNGHVPYRDSKITRILQNSLGGNARTAIICTINPAHSHVEQSRNTLVFGSCAKQVTNNAQVNILKSDKALIEQMRKEFEKLKNKMKSLEASSSTANSSSLLREKELLIEQMDREIKELTRQRDTAQSRMQTLLHSAGQGEPQSVDDHPTSKLSVAVNQVGEQNNGDDFGCLFQSGEQDWLFSIDEEPALEALATEDKKTEELTYQEVITQSHLDSFAHSAGQESLSIVHAYPVSNSPCADKTINDYRGGAVYCKEIRGIKMEDSGRNLEALPSLSYERREVKSPMTVFQYEDAAAYHRKEDYEANDITADDTYDSLKQQVHDLQKTIEQLVAFLPIDQSPIPMDNGIGTPSPITICRREVLEQQLTPSQSPPFRTQPARRCYQVSEVSAFANESNIGSDEDTASVVNFVLAKNNRARRQFKEDYNKITVKAKASNARDVSRSQQGSIISQGGSQLYTSGLTSVPERQWRDIIKLWDSCNAPLAHRTHFFLLFKGDLSDTLYLEVELRKLCFLRDSFAVGSKIMENDQVLTWDSSAKALNSERKMLSKQIHKKYRRKERAGLYEMWGIDLTTKHRSIQLAWKLWSSRDMDHVRESADLVAKLVGSQKLGQAPKEMLGLSFPQRKQRKISRWKDNMSLLSFSSFV